VEAELFHSEERTDGLTDVTKLIVAFRYFAKDTKMVVKLNIKKNRQIYSSYSIVAEVSVLKGNL
jgi:hypothetical protein